MNRNFSHLLQRLRVLSQRWGALKKSNTPSPQFHTLHDEIVRLYRYLSARLHRRTLRRAMGAAFAVLGVGFSQTSEAQTFAPPISSPFGLSHSGQTYLVAADLVDLDGDGDLDVVGVPYYSTSAYFWQNTGTSSSPDFSTPATVLTGAQMGGYTIRIDLADMDDDGDYDLISGEYYGVTKFFENTGTASSPTFAAPLTNPFGITPSPFISFPNAVDLDDDGDLDLAIGDFGGGVRFFENVGTTANPSFGPAQLNPFGMDTTNYFNIPELVDLDADGDYDMLSGENYGGVVYFENEGNASTPAFSAPISSPFGLSGIPNSYLTMFTSGDLDNDGDMDLLVSDYGGIFRYYENTLFNVGQEELNRMDVTVYPNPASELLNISADGIEVKKVSIFDIRGALVLHSSYEGQAISVKDLSIGVYQLHIQTDKGVRIEKLIVE